MADALVEGWVCKRGRFGVEEEGEYEWLVLFLLDTWFV